ncbi:hypothetical protein AtNW77_Chr4g0315881 [Arabidopsis thaliana]|uniref:Transmembrane protein n=2 Tax=Arabidopsis TaxID=3701 RepID=O23235_ARATH|nr:uncharacterized protein AT4G36460 [Arabidopsis thaliana]AEE86658.1 transmembrane protein [Arabidopsis thaliana]KAG7618638.1 hypothetical protein ISN45_At04g038710 [Arabidopsis thaliana x Arabidopsis arenosa]CAB16846.1 hypothetical protein [Arabidopsis thaliana]CAB80312.1 hypothetical protein [Arabidopsis thaliana]|eukprot:NP_195364.1 transmembrane protein [Arabidopsis thaliana]
MVPEELKIISFDGEKEVIGVVGRIIKSFLDGKGKVNAGFRENVLYLVNVCLRIVCLVTYQKFEPYEDFGSATTVVASTITSIITVWLLYNKFEMGIYDKIEVFAAWYLFILSNRYEEIVMSDDFVHVLLFFWIVKVILTWSIFFY